MRKGRLRNNSAPGEVIIRACKQSRVINNICKTLYVKRISHDYFQMWHEAKSNAEQEDITTAYRREIVLALIFSPIGLNVGTGMYVAAFTPAYMLVTLPIIAIIILYLGR